jgi:hypothetical protein
MLFTNPADRNLAAGVELDCHPKDLFAEHDALRVVTQRPVTNIGEVAFPLVKDRRDDEFWLRSPTESSCGSGNGREIIIAL